MTTRTCKNCLSSFDSEEAPEHLLCSWHPADPENIGTAGPYQDFAEIWRWSCCNKTELGPIVNGSDRPPARSPGCRQGTHQADMSVHHPEQEQTLESPRHPLSQPLGEDNRVRNPILAAVFVSYSHSDRSFVSRLTQRLQEDQVNFWLDTKDLSVGDVIDRSISEAIQKHALFLVILTPASIKSQWVARELDEASHEATHGGKILLPIIAGGLRVDEVPARLRRIKGAVFNDDFNTGYNALIAAIRAHTQRLKAEAS